MELVSGHRSQRLRSSDAAVLFLLEREVTNLSFILAVKVACRNQQDIVDRFSDWNFLADLKDSRPWFFRLHARVCVPGHGRRVTSPAPARVASALRTN